jgi:hypothetical protein
MHKAGILLMFVLVGCSGNKLAHATAESLVKRFLSSNPARMGIYELL